MTINVALRQHVTSASFALVLGSTHIAALVWTDHMLRRNRSLRDDLDEGTYDGRYPHESGPHSRAFRNHATGMNGLVRRGLVIHTRPPQGQRTDHIPPSDIWEITEAGRLVIGLLRESGLWAEYGGQDEPAKPELIGAAS